MAASSKVKAALGYSAFGVAAFVFCVYLTFPYEMAEKRVISEAARAGLKLHIGEMGPGLFGVTATNVTLDLPSSSNAKKHTPLRIDSVAARPSLFPLGVALRAKVMGGTAHIAVGGLSDLTIDAELDGLDPSKGNLEGATGLKATGALNGDASLSVPKSSGALDWSKANGTVSLDLQHFEIQGGTVPVPMGGGTVMPMGLPKLGLGDVHAKMTIAQGKAKLTELKGTGGDLQLLGGGTVALDRHLPYSKLDLKIRVKADPKLVQRLGFIGSALSLLPEDRQTPGFRLAHIIGPLGLPTLDRSG